MMLTQETERVHRVISTLLDEIYQQNITESSMFPLILSNDEQQAKNLMILDGLLQSTRTSLQFGQYRRAVWYLQAFSLACDHTFGDRNKECVIQALNDCIAGLNNEEN